MVVDRQGGAYVGNFGFPLDEAIEERGEILATVSTSQPCFACVLGGAQRRTLFMLTAPTSVAKQARSRAKAASSVSSWALPVPGFPEQRRAVAPVL